MTYRYQDLDEYNWLMGEIIRHETDQAVALGHLLAERLSPGSVIDVGCGPGLYLLPFAEHGADIYGVDGAGAAGALLQPAQFELVDLRNPWTPPRRYDLALCIEVAEHLRPEHAGTLVGTLARCADVIFFTAARPGQGGEGHYNEQSQDYWLGMFGAHGYGVHPRHSEIKGVIDHSYRHDPQSPYKHCHWLHWNGLLLGKAQP